MWYLYTRELTKTCCVIHESVWGYRSRISACDHGRKCAERQHRKTAPPAHTEERHAASTTHASTRLQRSIALYAPLTAAKCQLPHTM